MMPRILAVANQKGGSGKTTTTVNLAAALAEQRVRVLVIDLDAQASASSWLGVTNPDNDTYDVLCDDYDVSDVIVQTGVDGLDLAPASDWLMRADSELSGEVGSDTVLRGSLGDLSAYEYVLIDTSPALGKATINALVAADAVLVPVEASSMALGGLARLMNTIKKVRERLNPELELAGVLACQVDRRTIHAQEVVDTLREHFEEEVFETIIRQNVRLKEAPSYHKPITIYDDRSAGAEDYRSLAKELTNAHA